jgi:sulfotransferase family protein
VTVLIDVPCRASEAGRQIAPPTITNDRQSKECPFRNDLAQTPVDTTKLPDFFVVGAAKAGTTAVWQWLRQHPEVFLPEIKEPSYFCFAGRSAVPRAGLFDPDYVSRIAATLESYQQLYETAGAHLKGDVSPVYFSSPEAAGRIAELCPNAKIVVILRDPVTRAFSQYLHHRRDCIEDLLSFSNAIQAEERRMAEGWSWAHAYTRNGEYSKQVSRYLSLFRRSQILFVRFEDLQDRPEDCWHQLCEHIGVSRCRFPQNRRVNETRGLAGLPSFPGLVWRVNHPGPVQKWLKRLFPSRLKIYLRNQIFRNRNPIPELDQSDVIRLVKHYQPEVKQLEEMTGLDLSKWLPRGTSVRADKG